MSHDFDNGNEDHFDPFDPLGPWGAYDAERDEYYRYRRQQPAKKPEPQESMSVGLFLGLLGVFLIVMIFILAH